MKGLTLPYWLKYVLISCSLAALAHPLAGCSSKGSWAKVQGPYFVVRAEGAWCTWSQDARACNIKEAGTYLLDRTGEIVADDATLPENDPSVLPQYEDNECPDMLASGAACSPNAQDYAIRDVNDPEASKQWALTTEFSKELEAEFSKCTLYPSVVVAVVDTGVSAHPDLSLLPGKSFISGTENDDKDGHGTHVAGICCALTDNATGGASISGGVKVLPVRFIGPSGGSTFNTVRSIDYVTKWQKDHPGRTVILNASFGSGGYSRPVEYAIRDAIKAGVIVVVAAGNDGEDLGAHPSYPASLTTGHITVGSHNKENKQSYFSNYGKRVDVILPGENILSTCKGNKYCVLSGTSMATPYAAGAIARIACGESSDPKKDFLVRYGKTGTHISTAD